MLGKRIKERRNEVSMTQQELTKKLGVPKTSIHYWEKGLLEPILQSIEHISRILEVNPCWIVGWSSKKEEM